ncbi:MAG: WD40/YVTN/BNR-like repeat-containing protein [Bdellovibrionales bacterium]
MESIKTASNVFSANVICCLVILFNNATSGAQAVTQVAPGGGGSIPHILLSPNVEDKDIVLAANNMGVVFRSIDGGLNYSQIDEKNLRQLINGYQGAKLGGYRGAKFSCARPWAWTRPNSANRLPVIFAGSQIGFFKSEDKGVTWLKIAGFERGPSFIAFNPTDSSRGAAVFDKTGGVDIYITYNSGKTWFPLEVPTDLLGEPRGLFFDALAKQPMNFIVATDRSVYNYGIIDGTSKWIALTGLPDTTTNPIKSVAGASHGGRLIAYLTYLRTDQNQPAFYTLDSTQDRYGWRPVNSTGLALSSPSGLDLPFYDFVSVSESNPAVAYVAYDGGKRIGDPLESEGGDGGVFKTTDFGKTWQESFFLHHKHKKFNVFDSFPQIHSWLSESSWIWAQKPDSVFISPVDENLVVLANAGTFTSKDGGAHWNSSSAPNLKNGVATPRGGIPVLHVSDYAIAPAAPGEPRRHHYLANSDFGVFHSLDGGNSWIRHDFKKFPGNVNRYTFDDTAPGRVWAAGGGAHNLPFLEGLKVQAINTYAARFAYSEDHFQSSRIFEPKVNGKSINASITEVFVDKKPDGTEDWYLAALGREGGVYRGNKDAESWTLIDGQFWTQVHQVNSGGKSISGTRNRNVFRIGRLPSPDNRLFMLTTSGAGFWDQYVRFPGSQGLFVLNSQGSWELIKDFNYASDIEFLDEDKIYVSEMGSGSSQGAVWECKSGAQCLHSDNWTKLFDAMGVAGISIRRSSTSAAKNRLYISLMTWGILPESAGSLSHLVPTPSDIKFENNQVYIMTIPSDSNGKSYIWKDQKFPGVSPLKIRFLDKLIFYPTSGDGVFRVLSEGF